jgi:hypothetical protein
MSRWSAVMVCVAWCAPSVALADPVRASLAWVRGDGADRCPDADALRAALARRLGYDPTATIPASVPAAPSVSVEVVVTRGAPDAPWSAALFARAPDGTLLGDRHLTLRADSCAPLVDAVALALAASLDGDALARPAPPPDPPPPPAPVVVTPPPPPPPRPAPRARRWGVAATASAGVALGVLPGAAPVAALAIELRPPRWPTLVVTGLYQPDAAVDLPLGRAVLRLALVGLAVCPWRAARGPLSLSLCAGALGGVLVAAGEALAVNRLAERPYAAVEAGARARWSAGRYVHLTADAHAVAPLVRDTLVVDGLGDVVRVSPVGLRATIGVGVHFE